MHRSRGFTLIELMIVVAIIALLAAIALPAYLDYVARTQVVEGYSLASDARTAVSTYYADRQNFPADNEDAGLADPDSIVGRYVSRVVLQADGLIEVEFGNSASAKIAGEKLALTMENAGGSLRWTCSGLDPKYLPSACR